MDITVIAIIIFMLKSKKNLCNRLQFRKLCVLLQNGNRNYRNDDYYLLKQVKKLTGYEVLQS